MLNTIIILIFIIIFLIIKNLLKLFFITLIISFMHDCYDNNSFIINLKLLLTFEILNKNLS
jgi:hypothetical protein